MTFFRDPADMTSAERYQEIAGLLGQGYIRLLVSQNEPKNDLDITPDSEPPWPRLVDTPESTDKTEDSR